VTVSDGTVVNIDTTAAVVAFCGSPGDGEASQLAALTGDSMAPAQSGSKSFYPFNDTKPGGINDGNPRTVYQGHRRAHQRPDTPVLKPDEPLPVGPVL
jgi:hypothetical protein